MAKRIRDLIPLGSVAVAHLLEVDDGGALGRYATLQTLLDGLFPAWITPTFDAADFTANDSMTWTVEAGDVKTYAYQIYGRTMHIAFSLEGTTVGGTPSTNLEIKIPANKYAAKQQLGAFAFGTDNGVVVSPLVASVVVDGTVIRISRSDSANWTASTNNTNIHGSMTLEVVSNPFAEEVEVNGTDITMNATSVLDLSGGVFGIEYGIGDTAAYTHSRASQGAVAGPQTFTIGAADGITTGSNWSVRTYYNLDDEDPIGTRVYGVGFVVAV